MRLDSLAERWQKTLQGRRILRAARLHPTPIIDLVSILAIAGLIGALIATGEAAYTKYQSNQAVAAAEQMVASFEDRLGQLQADDAPAYQIRFAQTRLDAANTLLKRIRADERAYLDAYGEGATQAALINYIKGKLITSDFLSAAENAFNNAVGLSNAYSAKPGEIQQNYENAVTRLLGNDTTLQGDALDRYIAVAEYQNLVRLLQAKGYNPNDPAFVNTVRRFAQDYYMGDGETPPPAQVRTIMDQLIAETYGLPMPDDVEGESTDWMTVELPDTLVEQTEVIFPDTDSDLIPTPYTQPTVAETPTESVEVELGEIPDLSASYHAFYQRCLDQYNECIDRRCAMMGNVSSCSWYCPEFSAEAPGLIYDSRWWWMDPSYHSCAEAAGDRYLAALQVDVEAFLAGTIDVTDYMISGETILETLRSEIAACRATACQNSCTANGQVGVYTGTPNIDDRCDCQ